MVFSLSESHASKLDLPGLEHRNPTPTWVDVNHQHKTTHVVGGLMKESSVFPGAKSVFVLGQWYDFDQIDAG